MDKRFSTKAYSVSNCEYHLVWCVKYRKKILLDGVDVRLKDLLNQKSNEHGWEIKNMEINPEYVRISIKATTNDAPIFVVSQFKVFTANILRKEFPYLKSKLPTLWTRNFYCETIGRISEKQIIKYIEDQKTK